MFGAKISIAASLSQTDICISDNSKCSVLSQHEASSWTPKMIALDIQNMLGGFFVDSFVSELNIGMV